MQSINIIYYLLDCVNKRKNSLTNKEILQSILPAKHMMTIIHVL